MLLLREVYRLIQRTQREHGQIPFVTLGLMGICCSIHMIPELVDNPHLHDVCIYVPAIINSSQYFRLISAALFHGSDTHLYYNMVSLLWKGSSDIYPDHPYNPCNTLFHGIYTALTIDI